MKFKLTAAIVGVVVLIGIIMGNKSAYLSYELSELNIYEEIFCDVELGESDENVIEYLEDKGFEIYKPKNEEERMEIYNASGRRVIWYEDSNIIVLTDELDGESDTKVRRDLDIIIGGDEVYSIEHLYLERVSIYNKEGIKEIWDIGYSISVGDNYTTVYEKRIGSFDGTRDMEFETREDILRYGKYELEKYKEGIDIIE